MKNRDSKLCNEPLLAAVLTHVHNKVLLSEEQKAVTRKALINISDVFYLFRSSTLLTFVETNLFKLGERTAFSRQILHFRVLLLDGERHWSHNTRFAAAHHFLRHLNSLRLK